MDRVIQTFCDLVKINSLSLKERQMGDELIRRLKTLGLDVTEDNSMEKTQGNCGNIQGILKGNPLSPKVLFAAHMDTVHPGEEKKAVVKNGIISSVGETVLGADDLLGIAAILEMLETINEEKIPHGDIVVLFTVAEEIGLVGAKALEQDFIEADYGYILDDVGPPGGIILKAPYHVKLEIDIKGKGAHSGIEPEKGIDSMRIFAQAVSNMRLGRIDEETTSNLGMIHGGEAMNIVCPQIHIVGEVRSLTFEKVKNEIDHIKECFEEAKSSIGGEVVMKEIRLYDGLHVEKDSPVFTLFEKAAKNCQVEVIPKISGGGSDTNIISKKGINAVNLAIGYYDMHTTNEHVAVEDVLKVTQLIMEITKEVEKSNDNAKNI